MLDLYAMAAIEFPLDLSKVSSIVLLLIAVQAVLIVIALLIFLILFLRKRLIAKRGRNVFIASTPAADERTLSGITLDASAAPHSFKVGDVFSSEGLAVTALYSDGSSAPLDLFTVEQPPMGVPGTPTVTVRYGGFTAYYTVEIAPAEELRTPIGMELDLAAVRRNFTVGEEFGYEGLRVRMLYTREPYAEEVFDFTVETPDMSEAGEKTVSVRSGGFVEFYKIGVEPAEEEEEEIALTDGGEGDYEQVLHVDRSFTAKLILSDADTQRYYSAIKNELLSYKKVHARMSWKRETFKVSGSYVAKMCFRGNTLCLYLPLDATQFADTRYKVEDASSYKSSGDTSCLFRIKNDKRLRLAVDLIGQVMEEKGAARIERAPEDYTVPAQSEEELAEQGLIRYEQRLRKKGSGFIGKD